MSFWSIWNDIQLLQLIADFQSSRSHYQNGEMETDKQMNQL